MNSITLHIYVAQEQGVLATPALKATSSCLVCLSLVRRNEAVSRRTFFFFFCIYVSLNRVCITFNSQFPLFLVLFYCLFCPNSTFPFPSLFLVLRSFTCFYTPFLLLPLLLIPFPPPPPLHSLLIPSSCHPSMIKVWSCEQCFCILHLQCIQQWARDGVKQASVLSEELFPQQDIPWSCPKCRKEHKQADIPKEYTCFCKKMVHSFCVFFLFCFVLLVVFLHLLLSSSL